MSEPEQMDDDEHTALISKEQRTVDNKINVDRQAMTAAMSDADAPHNDVMDDEADEDDDDDEDDRREPLEDKNGDNNNSNNNVLNHGKWLRLRVCLMEPMILMLVFGYVLSTTVLKNRILYQTCNVIFDYNATVCQSLDKNGSSNSTAPIEKLVQNYASRIFMTMDVVQAIVPALFGVFVGVWTDRCGRKPLLVASFTGYGLSYACMAIISQMSTHYAISPWYYVVSVMPTVLTGGAVTYSVAAVCYISDVATDETKPYRMILYEAAMWVGLLLGSFCSGYLFELSGATAVFYTSAAIILVAAFIIGFVMPESLNLRAPQRVLRRPIRSISEITEQSPPLESTRTWDLCDFTILKLIWRTATTRREFNDRAITWLALCTILTTTFISDGSSSVFYMFVRNKLKWSLRQYTNYDTANMTMLIVGNLLGIWLLRKLCKFSLIGVAIIAFMSHTASCVLKAFLFIDWQLYVAAAIGCFRAISNPMCRTVLTNILPADELGKVLSLLGILQSLMSLVASPFYIFIYSITLNSFAGFFNLLSAHFCIVALVLLLSILSKSKINAIHYETILN